MSRMGIGVVLISLVALTVSGCGNNVVGPSAPDVIAPAATIQSTTTSISIPETSQPSTQANEINTSSQVGAACGVKPPSHKYKKNFLKNKWHIRKMVRRSMGSWMVKFYIHIYCSWYNIFPTKHPLKKIAKSNFLFAYIVLKHKIDRNIAQKAMEIVSQGWAPGTGTDPGGFDPEVTLKPYKWHRCKGFYGDLLPGWQVIPNSTDGYIFQQINDNGDIVFIDTKSYSTDIYKNNTDVYRYRWIYFHDPVDAGFYKIEFEIEDQTSLERVRLLSKLFDLDGVQTSIEIWNSSVDKSAYYRIRSNDNKLDLNLSFIADGSGGGSLDIENKHGIMDHYEYVMYANGHGYWTKNGGKKHCF